MNRWVLALIVCASLSVAAHSQTPGRDYRTSVLAQADGSCEIIRTVVLPELAKLGFRGGANLGVDCQSGDPDEMQHLVREIVDRAPDAILAQVLGRTWPATIPVEEPAAFRFGIDLRNARSLGVNLSPEVVVRADEVIE